MTDPLHFLQSLNDAAGSLAWVTARDLRVYSREFRRRIRIMGVRLPRDLWEGLLDWGRLGRFNAKLVLRKASMVQTWKRQLAAIIQAVILKVHEQLRRGALLAREAKKNGELNTRRCLLPPHLKRLKEYRCYDGEKEFWGFAGLIGEARRVYLDLLNGRLPALAVHLY